MQGALEAAPGVESVRYDSTTDRFVVRYRGQELSAFPGRVAAVVVLRRGRRLLEEIGHRLGLRRAAHKDA